MTHFVLHGAVLSLSWFLAVNVAASTIVARAARRQARSESATFWFAVRVLPACVATLFVAAVFVPSYWRYEPRDTLERIDLTLAACAIGAGGLLAAAGIRGASAWWQARSRVGVWMRTARPLSIARTNVRAFEVEAQRPIMALVGVLRPKLLVTRGLMNALSEEELAACVAHELGHSRAWDNLKRLAMRASPDALSGTSAAREIERRWASASEHAADRMAGRSGAVARCALASALVKLARLIPPEPAPAEPMSTILGGGEIASRVRRLLDDRALAPAAGRTCAWVALVIALVTTAVTYDPLLKGIHQVTEQLVHSLP
jgi:Zn-dependent protease with chaperone function